MRLFQRFSVTRMWSLILFLGVSSIHWTTGIEMIRGNHRLDIATGNTDNEYGQYYPDDSDYSDDSDDSDDSDNINKSLVKLTPINPNLESDFILDLSGLGLTSIQLHVFDNLTKLTNLNLSENKFSKIPQNVFSELHDLETLSFADNKIKKFDTTSLIGLNNLKLLDLSKNYLFDGLERNHLLNLPKSAEIIVKGINHRTLISQFHHAYPARGQRSTHRSRPHPWKPYRPSPAVRRQNWQNLVASALFVNPSSNTNKKYELNSLSVKVCLTDDGLLESVSIEAQNKSSSSPSSQLQPSSHPAVNKSSDHCSEVYPQPHRPARYLILKNFKIKQFANGWYQIADNQFSLIDLSDNKITEITAELLNGLPNSISMVQLDRNQIHVIRSGVIVNRFLEVLSLESNLISSIENGAFEKTNLESLHLTSNFLTNLNFTRTLPTNVTGLFLEKNNISEISENSFANLKALKYLSMSENCLTHLPANAFRGLKKLRRINFQHNSLQTIESETFSDNEKMEELRFSYNDIEELPAGSFNGSGTVKKIELDGNRIKKVNRDTFSGIKNRQIDHLNLGGNEIDTIEEGSFADMFIKQLDLSNNKLSEKSIAKGAFKSFKTIYLRMDNNSFTTVTVEAFSEIDGSLGLDNNQIRNINPGDAKYMTNIKILSVKGNGVNQLVNGALYGFPRDQTIKVSFGNSLNSIQAGVFEELNSTHVEEIHSLPTLNEKC